jgi:hypothetical protein
VSRTIYAESAKSNPKLPHFNRNQPVSGAYKPLALDQGFCYHGVI